MRAVADDDARNEPSRVGLCARCRHASTVTSSHGATFYLCRLSFTNPIFAKYPQLPMLACEGYQPANTGLDARRCPDEYGETGGT
jgi:hypothetical protein